MHCSQLKKLFTLPPFWKQFIHLLPWIIAVGITVGCGLNMALAKAITEPVFWTPEVVVDLLAESLLLFTLLFVLHLGFLIVLPRAARELLFQYLTYKLSQAAIKLGNLAETIVPRPTYLREFREGGESHVLVAAAFAVARSYRLKPTLARKHKTPLLLFQQANLLLAP
jgi:hypothetical protein